MKEICLPTLLQMRMLVGFLGERAQYAWWPTEFFKPSSRSFLEPVFPRTFRLARYHSVVEAARRLHDEHLNVGSYHLFRLPEEFEQNLHSIAQTSAGDKFATAAFQNKDAVLETLNNIAAMTCVSYEGPTAIGTIKSIDSPNTIETMAAAYVSAFKQNVRTYPYLTA
jgi:hypothetical protein